MLGKKKQNKSLCIRACLQTLNSSHYRRKAVNTAIKSLISLKLKFHDCSTKRKLGLNT